MAKRQKYKNNKKRSTENNINKNQKKVVQRLSQFSSLTNNLIKECTDLTENSSDFKALLEKKIIEKTENFFYKEEQTYSYKLTPKGQKISKNNGFTPYFSNSKKHDIAHATNVINDYKDQLDFYKSEKELPKIRGASRVDGAIISPQGTILLETITQDYSRQQISQKREYAKKYKEQNEYIEYVEMKD